MVESRENKNVVQNIIVENRKKISVSGVIDVAAFDENSIMLYTELGDLMIKGIDIKISKLNVDTGEITAEGEFDSFCYTSLTSGGKGGFFSKMFK